MAWLNEVTRKRNKRIKLSEYENKHTYSEIYSNVMNEDEHPACMLFSLLVRTVYAKRAAESEHVDAVHVSAVRELLS